MQLDPMDLANPASAGDPENLMKGVPMRVLAVTQRVDE